MKLQSFKVCYIVFLVLILAPVSSFGKTIPLNRGWITVIIDPVFNGEPLKMADQLYVNEHGDTIYIDLFRFYITNMRLSSESTTVSDTVSHLVDAEDEASATFHINNVPAGSYTSLQFTVGVDSITNTSGANGGDLDPAKGMYWVWNSGYIMAKLEGHSRVCKTLHHAFEFHIGGYMPPFNAARLVNVKLSHPVVVLNGCNTIVRLKADVAAWFKGNLDLSKLNSVVIPGKEANIIADNYAQMFSVE